MLTRRKPSPRAAPVKLFLYAADRQKFSHNIWMRSEGGSGKIAAVLDADSQKVSFRSQFGNYQYGIRVFGGHGYIADNGQRQEFRDARITTIYEGTTAIQGWICWAKNLAR